MVHRDFKPQNIVVEDATRRALLADFGIATVAGRDRLTMIGDVVGTVACAAPEQLADAEPDALVDMCALGRVLFELLAGHLPYERASLPAAIRAQQREPAPAASSLRHDLAGCGIDAVVRRAPATTTASAGRPRARWRGPRRRSRRRCGPVAPRRLHPAPARLANAGGERSTRRGHERPLSLRLVGLDDGRPNRYVLSLDGFRSTYAGTFGGREPRGRAAAKPRRMAGTRTA